MCILTDLTHIQSFVIILKTMDLKKMLVPLLGHNGPKCIGRVKNNYGNAYNDILFFNIS